MSNELVVKKQDTRFSCATQESIGKRISISPKEERITSVIAASMACEGTLTLDEGVKIDGEVRGFVKFGLDDGMCIVSKTGVVEGDIAGPRALILGTVQGDINISGVVLLAPSAVVIGNVSYGRLIVCDGAQISGQLNMSTTSRDRQVREDRQDSGSVVPLRASN